MISFQVVDRASAPATAREIHAVRRRDRDDDLREQTADRLGGEQVRPMRRAENPRRDRAGDGKSEAETLGDAHNRLGQSYEQLRFDCVLGNTIAVRALPIGARIASNADERIDTRDDAYVVRTARGRVQIEE